MAFKFGLDLIDGNPDDGKGCFSRGLLLLDGACELPSIKQGQTIKLLSSPSKKILSVDTGSWIDTDQETCLFQGFPFRSFGGGLFRLDLSPWKKMILLSGHWILSKGAKKFSIVDNNSRRPHSALNFCTFLHFFIMLLGRGRFQGQSSLLKPKLRYFPHATQGMVVIGVAGLA